MTRELRSTQPASEEFSEAVHWYEKRRSGLGAEFFEAVSATMALIAERPEVGTAIGAGGSTRRMLVGPFPYQVIYHLTRTEIVIVAVAHLKRRPNYWKGRQ